MHPEIRRDAPGSCPICGMALEPLIAAADAGPSPELADMTRRFWIGLALAVMLPTLAVSVRRLRDAGLHWAWIFISFVPGGSIALIVLWCQPAKPWALPRS